jgi:hypothetical protein
MEGAMSERAPISVDEFFKHVSWQGNALAIDFRSMDLRGVIDAVRVAAEVADLRASLAAAEARVEEAERGDAAYADAVKIAGLEAERDAAIARAEAIEVTLAAVDGARLDLMSERDALQAHVERLRGLLSRPYFSEYHTTNCRWATTAVAPCICHVQAVEAALSSTPEQNLTALREQVRREALEEAGGLRAAGRRVLQFLEDRFGNRRGADWSDSEAGDVADDLEAALATDNRVPEEPKP